MIANIINKLVSKSMNQRLQQYTHEKLEKNELKNELSNLVIMRRNEVWMLCRVISKKDRSPEHKHRNIYIPDYLVCDKAVRL